MDNKERDEFANKLKMHEQLTQNMDELDRVLDERGPQYGADFRSYLLGLLMREIPPGHFANLVAEAERVIR